VLIKIPNESVASNFFYPYENVVVKMMCHIFGRKILTQFMDFKEIVCVVEGNPSREMEDVVSINPALF